MKYKVPKEAQLTKFKTKDGDWYCSKIDIQSLVDDAIEKMELINGDKIENTWSAGIEEGKRQEKERISKVLQGSGGGGGSSDKDLLIGRI